MIKLMQAVIPTLNFASPFSLVADSTNTTANKVQVIAEMGQSNMEGRDGNTGNPSYPFNQANAYEWDGSNAIPLNTLRGDAVNGSHATYFAETYHTLTTFKPAMVEAAEGGTGLTPDSATGGRPDWSASSTLRGLAQTKVDGALTHYGLTQPFAAFWCQGERDAQHMTSDPSYTPAIVKAAMQDLIDWWFNLYPTSVFIISELGDFSSGVNNQDWQNMRQIQNEMAAENERVFIGFSGAKDFPSQGKMVDTFHYNYQGYKDMGEALASQLAGLITS